MAMPAPESIRPLRRVEYHQLIGLGAFRDEHIELLDGWLVEMSPIGPPHSSTVQKLNALLLPPLLERATVRIQSPFAASDTSEPEPDVAIVPIGDYDTEHPTQAYLVIEVADSSLQRDRDIKQRIYAQAGVPEYWIVNTAEKCIEVYRTPRAEGYLTRERVTDDGSVSLPNFADVQVQVRDLMPKSQPTAS